MRDVSTIGSAVPGFFFATTPVSTDVARPVVGALPLSMRFVFEG